MQERGGGVFERGEGVDTPIHTMFTKGKPRYFETWWWNKDVDMEVRRKREFRVWKPSRNEEDRQKHIEAKKMVRE